ncbi:MAG: GNAT family N-acetyltransferase [Actinomycetota bacterium]|nr:GNAT family N-acetyltransferase [Actinomycetota bacterium]
MTAPHVQALISRAADPAAFDVAVAVCRADAGRRDPGDPLPGPDELEGELLVVAPDRIRRVWVATLDGAPAGLAMATGRSTDTGDVRIAEVDVLVDPGLRRRGVGSALMTAVVSEVVALDRTSIIGYPAADLWAEESAAFCARYGLTARQEERCSRARVADIDESLLDRWLAEAADHAPGYRVVQWAGPCPDDQLLARWCDAEAAMGDAPLDDIDYQHHTRDLEAQRAADAATAARGHISYCTLALAPNGDAAGITELSVQVDRPQIGHQGDTGVLAAHRGHRLGRWLKAANWRQARAAHPELAVIETYNAQSNPWMLDINVAMGFRPHHVYVAHQAPVDTVLAAVEGRAAVG